MSTKRPFDTDNDSPDRKRSKMEQEGDFFYGKRIAILQSYGTTVCHVPADELQKIVKLGTARRELEFEGASLQVHDFLFEEPLVRFLAHWIHHRDPEEAVGATMVRRKKAIVGSTDKEWLAAMITTMDFFDDPAAFNCDITDSFVDKFIDTLVACEGDDIAIDQIYETCRELCKTDTLTSVFANVFIHYNEEFAKQAPTCDYDRAVQRHMHQWLTDVLIHNRDWDQLPAELGHHTSSACLHHKHGKDRLCYIHGKIVKSG